MFPALSARLLAVLLRAAPDEAVAPVVEPAPPAAEVAPVAAAPAPEPVTAPAPAPAPVVEPVVEPPPSAPAAAPLPLIELGTVVTGTRSERKSRDATVATRVIRREEIAASGAESAAEAVQAQTGIVLVPFVNGSGQNVQMQGLDSQYVLVLIDGQPATGKVGSAIDLSRFPAEQLERIEVVKGASSALYGSDAMGGVINLITRKGTRPQEWQARASYGSRNAVDASGKYGRTGERWSWQGAGGFHRADAWDLDPSTAQTSGASLLQGDASLRGGWDPTSTLKLTGRAEYMARDQSGVDASASGAVLDRRNLTETFLAAARAEATLPGAQWVNGLTYSQFRDQFRLDQRGAKDLDQYQATRQHLLQLESRISTDEWARQRLSGGVDARTEWLFTPRLIGGRGQRARGALFIEDEIRPLGSDAPRWVVAPGARLEADTQFGLFPAPKLATRFDPIDALTLRGSVGLGYRAPEFKELFIRFENPGVGYVVDGNPGLKPERSLAWNVGAELQPHARAWFAVDAFWNEMRDLIAPRVQGSPAPGTTTQYLYVNVSRARTRGVEGTFRLRPLDWVTTELGYTLLDARSLPDGKVLENRARHRVNAVITFRQSDWGTEAVLRGALTSSRTVYLSSNGVDPTDPTTAPAYGLLDLRVQQRVYRWLSVFVGARNLLDAGDVRYLPLAPRQFYGGLDVHDLP